MLVLRSSPASPFGRKVKLSASILGLSDRIQIVDADTLNPEDSIRRQNPLGKIPALILENGDVLYDSRVIVDFLDHLAGGGGIIPNGPERFSALRDQALADGITDAALLQVYEGRFRPEDRHEPKWVSHQADKVRRGLDHAEAHLSAAGQPLHIGQIALACALGYLDLRFGGRWRESYPRLVAWVADFESRVPAYSKTRVTP
ncbi:glutathione S-transferase N-terminal domain-containing protein [Microvirga sp. 3-52]|jgi:glutathione S-transferase|uniref:glutathione S-transferase n=1 Tax=Microvirga sp. 3-52 TaxID=2792425 RepID=UPI001ACAECAA|nr:glutathione S-transferase N-terminal domain-containing protein [Microvirga sp. 3-52]MBO1906246.1 glutathione S-transferase N-terminal domain-containing protein [Microvirga sp. 3-52]MBS7453577.1 glutathione S-transferase N-terminal domain-containing protein [Microvirga sp. 3-52]